MFYRVLGPTIVMVLAPGQQNAFSCLELLAQVWQCGMFVGGGWAEDRYRAIGGQLCDTVEYHAWGC